MQISGCIACRSRLCDCMLPCLRARARTRQREWPSPGSNSQLGRSVVLGLAVECTMATVSVCEPWLNAMSAMAIHLEAFRMVVVRAVRHGESESFLVQTGPLDYSHSASLAWSVSACRWSWHSATEIVGISDHPDESSLVCPAFVRMVTNRTPGACSRPCDTMVGSNGLITLRWVCPRR